MMRSSRLLRIALLLPICALLLMSQPGNKATSLSAEGNNYSAWSSIGISDDGRYVAFASLASNLVPSDTNTAQDIFVRDRQTGETTRVSVDSSGVEANGGNIHPAISGDGRYVVFASYASNFVPGDPSAHSDVFIHDLVTGETQVVSVNDAGQRGNGASWNTAEPPAVNGDGRFVAFWSMATNLILTDTNGYQDIFVRDRSMGTTTLVSVDSAGNQADGNSLYPAISADGCHVAFTSAATNLVMPDTNSAYDVFVHDCDTNATTLVSVDSTGVQGGGSSRFPSISGDGRYVAFASDATNLVSGDDNGKADVFVHDRDTGETQRVSVSSTGEQSNDSSPRAVLSADGRHVAFRSSASNLVSDDTNETQDVFVHDLQMGETTRVSVDSAGAEGNGTSSDGFGPAISSNGGFVAFYSWASNLVPFDTNYFCDSDQDNVYDDNCSDAFVHDMQTGETTRVSLASEDPDAGPDLVVEDMYSWQTMENYCYTPSGLVVVVKNIGNQPAGSSVTRVSISGWTADLSTPALAAGESTNVGVGTFGGDITATADWNNAVSETDETNNSYTEYVWVITLPTCTPTPTPTLPPLPLPISGRVFESPGCEGLMRGWTVVLSPLGWTTQTSVEDGGFVFFAAPDGSYELQMSPPCNAFGCWDPVPVTMAGAPVYVEICPHAFVPTPTATPTAVASDPVGGIAEPPETNAGLGGDGSSHDAIAIFAGAAGVIALMTCGWYARRRFRR
jgi:Tol biopolymer transport system component